MKKILASLFAVSALAFAAPVQAADMPVKARVAPVMAAPFSWTGFYIGGHVGGGWYDESWCRTGNVGPDGCAVQVPGANYANVDPSGILGGGQVGFNWQSGMFVFGLEASGAFAGLDGSGVFRNFNSTYVAHTNADAIVTAAARLGVAFDRTLVYAKGGGAWVNEDHWIVDTTNNITYGKTNVTRTGWLVGAGVEQAIGDAWSVKLEYNYMDFGSGSATIAGSTGGGGTGPVTIDRTVQTAVVGFNYRFGR